MSVGCGVQGDTAVDARHLEHVVDEPPGAPRLLDEQQREPLAFLDGRVAVGLQQGLGDGLHAGDRGPQLVRGVGDELSDRLLRTAFACLGPLERVEHVVECRGGATEFGPGIARTEAFAAVARAIDRASDVIASSGASANRIPTHSRPTVTRSAATPAITIPTAIASARRRGVGCPPRARGAPLGPRPLRPQFDGPLRRGVVVGQTGPEHTPVGEDHLRPHRAVFDAGEQGLRCRSGPRDLPCVCRAIDEQAAGAVR